MQEFIKGALTTALIIILFIITVPLLLKYLEFVF